MTTSHACMKRLKEQKQNSGSVSLHKVCSLICSVNKLCIVAEKIRAIFIHAVYFGIAIWSFTALSQQFGGRGVMENWKIENWKIGNSLFDFDLIKNNMTHPH